MTVAEFLISTDQTALASRYAADSLPAFYAWEEHRELSQDEALRRLTEAALDFLQGLKAAMPEAIPGKAIITQETFDEDDPEDTPWFTAVITEEALSFIPEKTQVVLPPDAIILDRRHNPEALGYALCNHCRDAVGQAAALLATLCCPGFPEE